MDIKTIILVMFVVVVCIYIYREFSNMKYEMTLIARDSEEKTNNMKLFIKEQNEHSVNRIKNLNNEYIHQIKKINMIHNEPIKKSSDCYTENDSECEIANKIIYLSDSTHECINLNNFHDFVPYMSHDEKIDLMDVPIAAKDYVNLCVPEQVAIILDDNPPNNLGINKLYKDSVKQNSNYVNSTTSNQDNSATHSQGKSTTSNQDKSVNSLKIIQNELNLDIEEAHKEFAEHTKTDKLKNIAEYKMDDLRKIAKDKGICLSMHDGKKTKLCSKQELYDKINGAL